MNRKLGLALIVGGLLGLVLSGVLRAPRAMAQKSQEAAWEYKVAAFAYNPGDNATDAQRAAHYEKVINEHAKQGWEPVGSVMDRTNVQTIGGGVTTRDSISFVAYRRPKR